MCVCEREKGEEEIYERLKEGVKGWRVEWSEEAVI